MTLWNRIEDLPRIEVRMLPDGRSVRYACRDYRGRGLGLLVESYGGEVRAVPERETRLGNCA